MRSSILKALFVVLGITSGSQIQAAPVIDLSNPVANSVSTITGINWRFNSTNPAGTTTPDSSGNGYTGNLEALTGSTPTLTTGVDLPGTSGYESGIRLAGSNSVGSPRVYSNLPVTNNLGMAATDFTGGAWISFDSIQSGLNQTVVIMDRGGMNTNNGANGGHWSFFLSKNTANLWQIGFQVGNGSAFATGYNSATPLNLNLQDGAWHHLGFTYDYGDGLTNNVLTFWLDGAVVGSASFSLNITSGSADSITRRFSVGERATSSYFSIFNGSMDDVFVTTGLYEFQAVPEPTIWALLILAAGVLVFKSRRRAIS